MVEVTSVAASSLPVLEEGGFHGSRKSRPDAGLVGVTKQSVEHQCYCQCRYGRRGSGASRSGVTVFILNHDAVLRPAVQGQPPESS